VLIVIPRAFSSGAASISSYFFARRQRRLAVIHVPDRPHVHVRLRALELALCHFVELLAVVR